MNIWVCMKQTFDTEEKIQIKGGVIDEADARFVINPYDEYAIEEAIRIRDAQGGEVTVVTVGPDRAESALRTALAMGADKAVLIDEATLPGTDEFVLSKVLSQLIGRHPFDLILGGNFAIDSGSGQVAIRLAEELNMAHVGAVTGFQLSGSHFTAERDAEGDTEVVTGTLPVLITAQQGLNEPRYPTLPGIMKAKRKPVERLSLSDLGAVKDLAEKTAVSGVFLPPDKTAGRILEGEPDDQVNELVQVLRAECHLV